MQFLQPELIALLVVLAAIMMLSGLLKGGGEKKKTTDKLEYQKRKVLLSPAERSFFGVLKQAVGDEALLFAKVRVADVLEPKKGGAKGAWQKAFNAISSKHFDYVICSNDDSSILLAVELDDASHSAKKRATRDEFLNNICTEAGLPLLRVPAKKSYSISQIRELVIQGAGLSNGDEPAAASKDETVVNIKQA